MRQEAREHVTDTTRALLRMLAAFGDDSVALCVLAAVAARGFGPRGSGFNASTPPSS